jgi:hypothetical protein
MMFDFDNDDLDFLKTKKNIAKEQAINKNEKLYLKYLDTLEMSVRDFTSIVKKLPEPNCQYRIVTKKNFNAITIIQLLLERFGVIENLDIAIYRMNQKSVRFLMDNIKNGKIKKSSIILSSFFRENKKYEAWCETLTDFINEQENHNIKFGLCHAKIILFDVDNRRFIFEGSGNLSDNARIEQYLFEQNDKVYFFHKEWMKEL